MGMNIRGGSFLYNNNIQKNINFTPQPLTNENEDLEPSIDEQDKEHLPIDYNPEMISVEEFYRLQMLINQNLQG